uniref:ABC transporter substrate-binding protein n=1 Tax=Ignisphaera aggregans TaxID=334771 RepID=A0A7J3Z4W9_9CREN
MPPIGKKYLIVAIAIVVIVLLPILIYVFHSIFSKPPLNQTKTPTSTPYVEKKGKIAVYAYRDVITGIDPGAEDDIGIVVLGLAYEPLLYYNPLNKEFRPALATEWLKVNDTAWIFKLRPSVKFHDGSPLTAEAVRFTIMRNKALYSEKGIGVGWIWDSVEDVILLNSTAVLFKLRYPAPIDLIASAAYGAYIYCPNVMNYAKASNLTEESIRMWFEQGNDCGTGPYKVVSYKPESEVILRKFEEWWGWKVVDNLNAPDVVIIKIVEDPAQQEMGLISGDIGIATNIPKTSIPNLLRLGYSVYNATLFYNYILMFNVRKWPTNITEFRKAIAYAIPWSEIVNTAFQGYGRLGSGLIPYGFPGHVEGLHYEYNLTKAKELLSSIGISSARLELVISSGYEEEERFAALLKSSLQQIGVTVDIIALPWEQVKEKGMAVWSSPEEAPHIIINDWWPTYATPYDFLYILHSNNTVWNWSGYANSDFDSIIDEAFTAEGEDYARALSLYTQAQRIVFEEAVALNLCDSVHPFIYDGDKIKFREGAFNPLYSFVIFFQYVEVMS